MCPWGLSLHPDGPIETYQNISFNCRAVTENFSWKKFIPVDYIVTSLKSHLRYREHKVAHMLCTVQNRAKWNMNLDVGLSPSFRVVMLVAQTWTVTSSSSSSNRRQPQWSNLYQFILLWQPENQGLWHQQEGRGQQLPFLGVAPQLWNQGQESSCNCYSTGPELLYDQVIQSYSARSGREWGCYSLDRKIASSSKHDTFLGNSWISQKEVECELGFPQCYGWALSLNDAIVSLPLWHCSTPQLMSSKQTCMGYTCMAPR